MSDSGRIDVEIPSEMDLMYRSLAELLLPEIPKGETINGRSSGYRCRGCGATSKARYSLDDKHSDNCTVKWALNLVYLYIRDVGRIRHGWTMYCEHKHDAIKKENQ